ANLPARARWRSRAGRCGREGNQAGHQGSIDPAPEGRNMEPSIVSRLQPESAPPDGRCPDARVAGLELFDAPVPPDLRQFGDRVGLSALGSPRNTPLLVVGGISANRFPVLQSSGATGWWP